jgi:hypothetical protein
LAPPLLARRSIERMDAPASRIDSHVRPRDHQVRRDEEIAVKEVLAHSLSRRGRPEHASRLAIELPHDAVARADVYRVACDRRRVGDSTSGFELPEDRHSRR